MNDLKMWLKVHSPTAQMISSAWAFMALLWETNGQFHDYIKHAFDALPKGVHAFMVGVVVPMCILYRSQRKNVAVAEAAPGETGTAKASATVEPSKDA